MTPLGWVAVAGVCLIALRVVVAIVIRLGPEVRFDTEVNDHLRVAREAETPERFIAMVTRALNGCAALGMRETDYDSPLPWEQTPFGRQQANAAYMNDTPERARDLVAWRDARTHESERDEDLYTSKMRNLNEACIWSASLRGVYLSNKHLFLYLGERYMTGLGILVLAYAGAIWLYSTRSVFF